MRLTQPTIIAVLAVACSVSAAMAADIPGFPKPQPPASRIQGVPDTCQEWTDDCRVCVRQPGGEMACSNIGIACLPAKPRCTRP